ncbi:hypothetical protein F6Y05_01630 (plasmid) [Bacillus megaterium]|nr:hypothetical protein [Priestia megaterium]
MKQGAATGRESGQQEGGQKGMLTTPKEKGSNKEIQPSQEMEGLPS